LAVKFLDIIIYSFPFRAALSNAKVSIRHDRDTVIIYNIMNDEKEAHQNKDVMLL